MFSVVDRFQFYRDTGECRRRRAEWFRYRRKVPRSHAVRARAQHDRVHECDVFCHERQHCPQVRLDSVLVTVKKFFEGEWELSESVVWKSAQRTPFKCAFCRSPRWSRFRHGTIQPRWVKSPILSRVLSFLHPEQPLLIIYQANLPTLGRDCYHIVNLLINVYIHRGEGQLPSRKYPRLEVRLLCFIYCIIQSRPRTLIQLLLFFIRSYLVLTAGFFFAPYRPDSDPEGSVNNVLGPMVTVRTLSESWRLFWSVP
jgi:hypothetical protein